LGPVGSVISEYLASTVKARMVWLTLTEMPDRADWKQWLSTHGENDPASLAIKKAQEIENIGASVEIETVDIANQEQMQAAIERTLERHGELNGIVHAAGQLVMGEEIAQTIQDLQEQDYETHFQTTAAGLIILERVLRGLKPDFCLLISSISSVLGGLGLTAYTAANIFMDAFARHCTNTTRLPWSTINLDTWQVDAQTGSPAPAGLGASLAELAISPSEGKDVFSRLFPLVGFHQVVISTAPLPARIDQWVKLISLREAAPGRKGAGTLHPRPSLPHPYIAPRNQVEQKMTEVWQQVLGIEEVGVNDDFFELGGNSLLATQLVMRMRETFQSAVPLRVFFETPTVAALATVVETLAGQAATAAAPKIKAIPRDSIRFSRQSLKAQPISH
jgi:acyl carrier protein